MQRQPSPNDRQVLDALRTLDHGDGPTIRELCSWIALQHDCPVPNPSVVWKALRRLQHDGFVTHDEGMGYHMSPEL